MKKILLLLLVSFGCFADPLPFRQENQKITIDNSILTKVNGNTISILDVVKKMDLILHQNYPQFADSPQAKFQFYHSSWRPIFMEMIDTELILSDAIEKEVKLTDGEIREELESRFGPSVSLTLDKVGLTYEEAWAMIKKDLLVRRMMWFFVHAKALQHITPQSIRDSYQAHLQAHPAYQEWNYRVVTLRAESEGDSAAQDLYKLCTEQKESPELLASSFQRWEQKHPGCSVQISTEYVAKDHELSMAHKAILSSLASNMYSEPTSQVSKIDGKTTYRLFFLQAKTNHPSPSFDEIAIQLKNELLQKCVAKESEAYMKKLRKRYGFDENSIKEIEEDTLHPFSIH